MNDSINNLNDKEDLVNNNFENEMKMKKLKEEVAKRLREYQHTMRYMSADAPIEILCLPKVIENALIGHGCLRVYDLFDCDFTKVKGLGSTRIRNLTTCLDQFFSMF